MGPRFVYKKYLHTMPLKCINYCVLYEINGGKESCRGQPMSPLNLNHYSIVNKKITCETKHSRHHKIVFLKTAAMFT